MLYSMKSAVSRHGSKRRSIITLLIYGNTLCTLVRSHTSKGTMA